MPDRPLPGGAAVLAVQQSGSIRYHGGRATLAWDAIEPRALDAHDRRPCAPPGRAPFIALEDGEEAGFRARFAGERFGALYWPPRADIERPVRVRLDD